MDLKTFKILETLSPHGAGYFFNISPLLISLFPPVNTMDVNSVRDTWGNVYRLLEDMKIAGLIAYPRLEGVGTGNQSGGYSWIDIIPINVSITQAGVDKLEAENAKGDEERLRESMLETNDSIKITNQLTQQNIRSQKNLTKTALWIAAISAFISLITLIREYVSKPDRSLLLEMQQKDSTLKSKELEIKSLSQRLQNHDSTLKPSIDTSLKTKR